MVVELPSKKLSLWLLNSFNIQYVVIVEAKCFVSFMEGLGESSSNL